MKRSMLTHQTATVKMRRLIMILIIFGVQIFGASIGPNEQNPGALSKSDGSVQNDADLAHVSNGSQVLDNKEKVENPENDPNNNPFDDDSFFNLINEEIAQTINSDGDPPKHELGDNEMDPDKLGTFSYIHKYSRKYDLEIPNKIYDKVHKFQADKCCFCQTKFDFNDKLVNPYTCGKDGKHFFHRKCIKKWKWKKTLCPVCRAKPVTIPAQTVTNLTLLEWHETKHADSPNGNRQNEAFNNDSHYLRSANIWC
eukprot:148112_1